jgi:hypothetical protein
MISSGYDTDKAHMAVLLHSSRIALRTPYVPTASLRSTEPGT